MLRLHAVNRKRIKMNNVISDSPTSSSVSLSLFSATFIFFVDVLSVSSAAIRSICSPDKTFFSSPSWVSFKADALHNELSSDFRTASFLRNSAKRRRPANTSSFRRATFSSLTRTSISVCACRNKDGNFHRFPDQIDPMLSSSSTTLLLLPYYS